MTAPIYLDHNAMSPMPEAVVETVAEHLRRYGANPSSPHALGRAARERLEEIRSRLGRLLGARVDGDAPDRVVLTSGGVEANHLAVLGIAHARTGAQEGRLTIGGMEHASVIGPAEHLLEQGWRLDMIGATVDGVLRLDQLSDWLTPETAVVSLIAANHETGVVQPIREAADICREMGVPLHTDAAQAVGKIDVDFKELGVDALSLSAQKFGGPPGVGALLLRNEVAIAPRMFGGSQQWKLRPGTECVALAAGMLHALELRLSDLNARQQRVETLRNRFETAIADAYPDAVIHGRAATRVANTTSIAFPGRDARRLLAELDRRGVCCSIGAACDDGEDELSPTLRTMGLEAAVIRSSLRFSLGRETTLEQVDAAADRVRQALDEMKVG